jgi:hypothetical protein
MFINNGMLATTNCNCNEMPVSIVDSLGGCLHRSI